MLKTINKSISVKNPANRIKLLIIVLVHVQIPIQIKHFKLKNELLNLTSLRDCSSQILLQFST